MDQVLLPADVLRIDGTLHARIAMADPTTDRLILFDLDGVAGFRLASLSEFMTAIRDGGVELLHDHVFDAPSRVGALSPKRAARGSLLMKAVTPLLNLGVELFDDRLRGSAVGRVARETGLDPKTVHAALDRYFRGGMTEDSVIPGFVGCGGPGKPKTVGEAKLGRPRMYGQRPGTNMTADLQRIVELGIRRYYARNGRICLAKARVLMLRDFCMERRVDPRTGTLVHTALPLYADEDFPTVRQISSWFEKNMDVFEIRRERRGRKSYDRNLRGVKGTAVSTTTGPGSRFEIDATIINIYVVSELEDGLVVGRPVLYVVVDVFSKMIVGFYVGLEGPSWTGAMMALVNVVENKKEFCARHGVMIEEEDWPCRYLPEKLLGDRGEIAGRVIEHLQRRHGVTVENAQSHRPDWKGSVEKRFDLIDAEFRPFVSGYVAPDFGERGAQDPRLDAVWTMSDLVPDLIRIILHFNNRHKLVDYHRDGQMIRDGVRAIPSELWEWGLEHRQGRMRRADPDAVRFSVMPVEKASVRHNGIWFKGMHYTCAKAEAERWYDRARQTGWFAVDVSFDMRTVTHIYMHDDIAPDGYLVCDLLPKDAHYAGRTFAEVAASRASDKHDTANRSIQEAESEADLATHIQASDERARERAKGLGRRRPKDLKDLRDNFRTEKGERRRDEAFDLSEDDGERRGENVVPFPTPSAGSPVDDDDCSEPTLAQMLNPVGNDR